LIYIALMETNSFHMSKDKFSIHSVVALGQYILQALKFLRSALLQLLIGNSSKYEWSFSCSQVCVDSSFENWWFCISFKPFLLTLAATYVVLEWLQRLSSTVHHPREMVFLCLLLSHIAPDTLVIWKKKEETNDCMHHKVGRNGHRNINVPKTLHVLKL
jgi:hypothetical protein